MTRFALRPRPLSIVIDPLLNRQLNVLSRPANRVEAAMGRDTDKRHMSGEFSAADARRAGDVADMVNDLYRLDCEVWGHPLDVAILRCIAATQWKTGQSARVRVIANTLGVSVATVHNRLKRLCVSDPADENVPPPLMRDRNGRYRLNDAGGV